MKLYANHKRMMIKAAIISTLVLAVVQGPWSGWAAAASKKSSGVTASQAATDIWHSYEVWPNYRYYYSGSDSRPNYIIGIDDRYQLTSKLWKPVDLTPEMLKNWINFTRPRVGYSPRLYGADITDSKGRRVGLWYSVRDWRLLGSATVDEKYQISVTRPTRSTGRIKGKHSTKY